MSHLRWILILLTVWKWPISTVRQMREAQQIRSAATGPWDRIDGLLMRPGQQQSPFMQGRVLYCPPLPPA